MRRRNRYNNPKKERAIMIASAVFVLAALTMTGVYVQYSSNEEKNDGYHIDFSSLENQVEDNNDKIALADDMEPDNIISDDALDYFPPLTEADSGGVEIPGLTIPKKSESLIPENVDDFEMDEILKELEEVNIEKSIDEEVKDTAVEEEQQQTLADEAAMAADAAKEQAEMEEPEAPEVTYSLEAGQSHIWPLNSSVLINYSMNGTVYFATLQQYKYNPGIVMAAKEGETITASASGIVTEVFYDEELGNGVKIDIGRGYTAIYGQLKDVQVTQGSLVSAGTVIGYIAAPTKYYSVEGTNAYFALEKDGKPVNPFGTLE